MNQTKLLSVAIAIAQLSKDESTKVGALIVGPSGEIRSSGWNGAPRGRCADEDYRKKRPIKYKYFEHAERNAIYNAARVGTPLEGCTMITTHYPCVDCCRGIIQSGIKHVIVPAPDSEFYARWAEDIVIADKLFAECGVTLEILE